MSKRKYDAISGRTTVNERGWINYKDISDESPRGNKILNPYTGN